MTYKIDFSKQKRVTVKVWSKPRGKIIKLKFEDPSATSIEVDVLTTTPEAWSELIFDFSSITGDNSQYSRMTIFPDFGSSGDENTYYFDNFAQSM
jgi:hypothetical protein